MSPTLLLVPTVLLAAAACRDGSTRGTRTLDVVAYAGDTEEPGAMIIGHAPDGTLIDALSADAVGRATIYVDDDSLVSIVFPGMITEITPELSIVTTMVPAGDELAIHGPRRTGSPGLVVGVLQLSAPNLPGADYFDVDVGCATVRVTRLPEYIDVGACSMGSDTYLDVLVRAYHDDGGDPAAPVLDGYAAGRAQMRNGIAMLDIQSWQTEAPAIPLVLDGVAPVVEWQLFVDGVELANETLIGGGRSYTNLAVDVARVRASIAGIGTARVTEREVAGLPSSIAFAAADFLPGIDRTTSLVGTAPLAFTWEPVAVQADALNLRASWQPSSTTMAVPTGHRVIWDAVLPPDMTSVTFPAVGGELGVALSGAEALVSTDVVLRYLDSEQLADLGALQAIGIRAEDTRQPSTIVPRAVGDELRLVHAIGLR